MPSSVQKRHGSIVVYPKEDQKNGKEPLHDRLREKWGFAAWRRWLQGDLERIKLCRSPRRRRYSSVHLLMVCMRQRAGGLVQSSLSTVGSQEDRGSCARGNLADSSVSADAKGALDREVLKAQSRALRLASVFQEITGEI